MLKKGDENMSEDNLNDQDFGHQSFDQKDEKQDEKGQEEKWRRDPLGSTIWALILIWLGVVWLTNNLGLLDNISLALERLSIRAFDLPFEIPFVDFQVWSIFFIGAGLLVTMEVIIRLIVPAYRRPVLGTIIWAFVLFGLGIGRWALIWPLILIALGVSIILRGLFR